MLVILSLFLPKNTSNLICNALNPIIKVISSVSDPDPLQETLIRIRVAKKT